MRKKNTRKTLCLQPPVEGRRLRSYSVLNRGHFLRKMKNDSEDAVKKPGSRAKRLGEPLLGLIKELVTCSQLDFRIAIDL